MACKREKCRIELRKAITHPLTCRNRSMVAERPADISQPQGGWYCVNTRRCPGGTMEHIAFPPSFQDASIPPQFPATSWPANFHRRFATTRPAFLDSAFFLLYCPSIRVNPTESNQI